MKRIILSISLIALIILPGHSTIQTFALTNSSASIQAHSIVWRYKSINGKLYCRQFDQTAQKWIGEWKPV